MGAGTVHSTKSKDAQQRRRTWHSKSKSGCQTCRKRRVKCDETKPRCRRCLSGGRECGGYAANPKPWLFESHSVRNPPSRLHHNDQGDLSGNESSEAARLGHPSASLLKWPYKTREDRLALEFWLRMTSPEATDPPLNALHTVFGTYLPQVAWHFDSVRHGLISAACTALSLEDKSGDPELRAAISDQSVVQMQLAIQTLLKQKELAISTVVTSLLFTFICGWRGKWDAYCIHLRSCLRLMREVKSAGQHHIDPDLVTCVETMVACTEIIPESASTAQADRMAYSHAVILSAKRWIDALIAQLGRRHVSEALRLALRYHRSRQNWILSHWKGLFPTAPKHAEVEMESSPYSAAYENAGSLQDDCVAFSLPLLSMQLSLALRTTLLFAAQGDSQRLKDTAFACHCPGEIVI